MKSKFPFFRKNSKKTTPLQKGPKNLIVGVIFFVLCLGFLAQLTNYTQQITKIAYSTFLRKVEANDVKQVHISGSDIIGELKNGERFETTMGDHAQIWDMLRAHGVEFSVSKPNVQVGFWHILLLLFFLLAIVPLGIWYIIRQTRGSGGGGGGIFNMGKSRAKLFMPSTIKENFDSVAGAAEAKEELQDVVDFLRNPNKYKRLGAKITRGVLLVGEPGNGKTLLARAVAGEANCPFFSVSGSDFIEVFVGIGAARVRDLFAQARKVAPSIVFIDEIDAVGRHRGSGLGGGHDEREQTLNQLLTEMDGFDTSGESVIVLAATNRPDVLDKALLRPGRFDRRVDVPFPDLVSRKQILEVHAKTIKLDSSVDLGKVARGTPGFSGADLANLINESAINASKLGKPLVAIEDIEESRDKILLGKEMKTIMLSEDDRKVTAYHEAGHALVGLLLPHATDPLHKITIIPRSRALGVTHSLPEREKYLCTRDEMLANIQVALGGRVAEELIFNQPSSGAYSDFVAATDIARKMVCLYGMTEELGEVVYSQQQGDFVYSQQTADKIDQTVRDLIKNCHERAHGLIMTNRDKLDKLAQALLEKETMYANEVYELLGIEPRQDFRLT